MKLNKQLKRARRTIRFIWYHPLVRKNRMAAFLRYFKFHLYSLVDNTEKIIPFIEDTQLMISKDLNGASTNYFTYLADFEEMMFLLHSLSENDWFLDIGSNVGTWVVLASGVMECKSIAIEPVKETYHKLIKNINLNNIQSKVHTNNIALGAVESEVNISRSRGALNRILDSKQSDIELVHQKTLDDITIEKSPAIIKIDVEGYEMQILKGGKRTLSNPELQSIIIELKGNALKYGSSDEEIHHILTEYGFVPVIYAPFSRELKQLPNFNTKSSNTIYVRNIQNTEKIVRASRQYQVGKYRI